MSAPTDAPPAGELPVAFRIGVAMASDADPAAPLESAISEAAAEAGCAAAFADPSDTVAGSTAAVRTLRAQGVDGFILLPALGADTVITELVRLGIPTVLVHRLAARDDVDQVGTDFPDLDFAPTRSIATTAVALLLARIADPTRPTELIRLP